MKLTGKCKEDFEKWLNINFHEFSYKKFHDEYDAHFYKLPFSMQYGVYVDFFDSVGVIFEKQFEENTRQYFGYVKNITTKIRIDIREKSLNEYRIKAIEKANEIRNSQL